MMTLPESQRFARALGFVPVAFSLYFSGCGPTVDDRPLTATNSSSLLACRSTLSLGVIDHGQAAEAVLTLENPRKSAVEVSRIETTCPCLRVTPDSIRVGPRTGGSVTVRFDTSEEPDFSGGLSIDVIGRGLDEAIIFRTKVDLVVRAQVSPSQGANGAKVSGGSP
jgi:hypothetical protein